MIYGVLFITLIIIVFPAMGLASYFSYDMKIPPLAWAACLMLTVVIDVIRRKPKQYAEPRPQQHSRVSEPAKQEREPQSYIYIIRKDNVDEPEIREEQSSSRPVNNQLDFVPVGRKLARIPGVDLYDVLKKVRSSTHISNRTLEELTGIPRDRKCSPNTTMIVGFLVENGFVDRVGNNRFKLNRSGKMFIDNLNSPLP